MDALKRLIRRAIFPVYRPVMRLVRGQTLGVRCILVDRDGRVLLVRHSYAPGWSFPGGGVERGETVREALGREIGEEAGIAFDAPPRLHGLFANFEIFPGDHVAVFVADDWHRTGEPQSGLEITDRRFFALEELPAGTTPGTRRRLDEIFAGIPVSESW